jgi:hypothetical protein
VEEPLDEFGGHDRGRAHHPRLLPDPPALPLRRHRQRHAGGRACGRLVLLRHVGAGRGVRDGQRGQHDLPHGRPRRGPPARRRLGHGVPLRVRRARRRPADDRGRRLQRHRRQHHHSGGREHRLHLAPGQRLLDPLLLLHHGGQGLLADRPRRPVGQAGRGPGPSHPRVPGVGRRPSEGRVDPVARTGGHHRVRDRARDGVGRDRRPYGQRPRLHRHDDRPLQGRRRVHLPAQQGHRLVDPGGLRLLQPGLHDPADDPDREPDQHRPDAQDARRGRRPLPAARHPGAGERADRLRAALRLPERSLPRGERAPTPRDGAYSTAQSREGDPRLGACGRRGCSAFRTAVVLQPRLRGTQGAGRREVRASQHGARHRGPPAR